MDGSTERLRPGGKRAARIGRQVLDALVLAAGGIGLALPLILPFG